MPLPAPLQRERLAVVKAVLESELGAMGNLVTVNVGLIHGTSLLRARWVTLRARWVMRSALQRCEKLRDEVGIRVRSR